MWNKNGTLLNRSSSTIYYFLLKAFLEISSNLTANQLSLKLLYFLSMCMMFSGFKCLCSIVYSEINVQSEVLLPFQNDVSFKFCWKNLLLH